MKRSKNNELPVKKDESTKSDTSNAAQQTLQDDKLIVTKEETTADHFKEPKMIKEETNADHVEEPIFTNEETNADHVEEPISTKEEINTDDVEEPKIKDEMDEEDPEEDPEEYEEMDDPFPQPTFSNEKKEEKAQTDPKPEKELKKDEAVTSTKSGITTKAASTVPELEGNMSRKEQKVDPKKKVHAINTDLLQAFRFFDRNQVGYIRVEDLRLVIHSLGKFLSHRDVKELVQSALLESNTGRDDHILYDKLVRMSDI